MIFTYIPCKDTEEAKKIGRALIEEKAVGCVNIFPIQSMFPADQGGIEETSEVSLIVKTIDAKIKDVERIVRALHSYKVPCIASFSLHRLNREYRDWLVRYVA